MKCGLTSLVVMMSSLAVVQAQDIDVSAFSNQMVRAQSQYVPQDPRVKPFLEVSFRPELDTQMPIDLEFRDSEGIVAPMRERMAEGKPSILAIVYYRCPTMCNAMINGMIASLREIHYKPGQDFNVVAVSFDANETHLIAAGKKRNSLEMYGETEPNGWHFLVGEEQEVGQFTDAANFRFKYDPVADQYAHGSGLLILTPEGKISRFLPGLSFEKRDLQLSLVEAGQGKIGKISDRLALLCFHYDPETGKYGLLVHRTVMVACFATVGAVALLIGTLLRQERRTKERESQEGGEA